MRREHGAGLEEIEGEIAVGDGVDRVRHHAGEAEIPRDEGAIGIEVHARERAGAERGQHVGLAGGEAEPLAIAHEHPDVGEQVVCER